MPPDKERTSLSDARPLFRTGELQDAPPRAGKRAPLSLLTRTATGPPGAGQVKTARTPPRQRPFGLPPRPRVPRPPVLPFSQVAPMGERLVAAAGPTAITAVTPPALGVLPDAPMPVPSAVRAQGATGAPKAVDVVTAKPPDRMKCLNTLGGRTRPHLSSRRRGSCPRPWRLSRSLGRRRRLGRLLSGNRTSDSHRDHDRSESPLRPRPLPTSQRRPQRGRRRTGLKRRS